jgi:hypothetical protein
MGTLAALDVLNENSFAQGYNQTPYYNRYGQQVYINTGPQNPLLNNLQASWETDRIQANAELARAQATQTIIQTEILKQQAEQQQQQSDQKQEQLQEKLEQLKQQLHQQQQLQQQLVSACEKASIASGNSSRESLPVPSAPIIDDSLKTPSKTTLCILNATYGADSSFNDVTSFVQSKLSDGGLHFRVNSKVLGGDPIFGKVKTLNIQYSLNGHKISKSFCEGDQVSLP